LLQLDPGEAPPSFEGSEVRCFRSAFFCGRNLPVGAGSAPEDEARLSDDEVQQQLANEVPIEPYSYGQAVAAYMQQQQQQLLRRQGQVQLPDAISLQQAAAAHAGQQPNWAASNGSLRVLLLRRGGEGRQVLNAAEVLERCNAWRYSPPGSTVPVTAVCSEAEVPDLQAGVAAAQEADVFIGMHGG
jgi:hypothetical protein